MRSSQSGDSRVSSEVGSAERGSERIMDQIPALLAYLDRQGHYQFANTLWQSWLGLAPDQILGQRIETVLPESVVRVLKPQLESALTGRTIEFELSHPRQDDMDQVLRIRLIPDRNAVGLVQGCVLFALDVTQHRQVEADLRQNQARYALAVRAGRVGVWDWDLQTNDLYMDPNLKRMLGFSPEAISNDLERWLQLIHPDDRASWFATVQQYLAGAIESLAVEHRLISAQGEAIWCLAQGSVVPDRYGHPRHLIGTHTDISERKRATQQQDEFISIVSHELRSPLTSLRGSLTLLQTGALGQLDPKGQELLTFAVADTERLVRLVQNILDLECLKLGHLPLDLQPVAVMDLFQHAIQTLATSAGAVGVELVLEPTSITVLADHDRIIEVLLNLIDNAIKYSQPGGQVRLRARPQSDQGLIEIEDHGIGIREDHLAWIFEPFHQVDRSDARQREGTGLGLAICRFLVTQHGGTLGVASQVGIGSRFYFTLPLAG